MHLYDPSYFGKIINILQILKGGCKLLTSTVFKQRGAVRENNCVGLKLAKKAVKLTVDGHGRHDQRHLGPSGFIVADGR